MRLAAALGTVACASVLAACGAGGDSHEDGIGVPVPEDAREAAVEEVRSTLDRAARSDHVSGPESVQCEAVANRMDRPVDKRYDHRCLATFPNGGTMECTVGPVGSNAGMTCDGALLADPPAPGVHTSTTD